MQEPLDSVLVYNSEKTADKSYTNASGHFDIQSISGGLFGCPAMSVIIEKRGYEKQTMTIDCGAIQTISLKKIR